MKYKWTLIQEEFRPRGIFGGFYYGEFVRTWVRPEYANLYRRAELARLRKLKQFHYHKDFEVDFDRALKLVEEGIAKLKNAYDSGNHKRVGEMLRHLQHKGCIARNERHYEYIKELPAIRIRSLEAL